MSDLKHRILEKFGLGVVEREVLGEKVWIRKLPPAAVESHQFSRLDKKTKEVDYNKLPGMKAELVQMCLSDATGQLLFQSVKEVNDGELGNPFVDACYEVCQEVNGMTKVAAQEIEKNS